MEKLPISAVLVIYNEEKILERCIKSFSDLVSEIIVVHDGKCSDNSLKIARKYTNKIYIKRHFRYPEVHRPFTYSIAKYDWLLQLDADEFLSKKLHGKIADLIKKKVDIYDFSWPGYFKGKHYPGSYKRTLFRKSKVYYYSLLNQNVLPINKSVVIKRMALEVMHEPTYEYLTFKYFKKRHMMTYKIHARQLLKKTKFYKWNCKEISLEERNKIRVRYPILFGIFGSVGYHSSIGLINFIKTFKFFYLKQAFFTSLYCTLLFKQVFLLKRSNMYPSSLKP